MKINNKQNIIRNILTIILILNIIISGIMIGSPITQTYRPIIIATMILCGMYLLISKNKIKVIRNKADIFIILLGISTLIPLIFNKAVSITSEINYIFKYMSAILLYICVREHLINYPETRKILLNVIIGLSILLIIFGIDSNTSKILEKPLNLINIEIEDVEQNRMASIFCYANAFAIVIAISIILNNFNYLSEKNRIRKSIYGTITTFLLMGLLLTYSRLVMLFLAVFLIIYIILLKNKAKRYDLIKMLFISTILAYIYNSIYFSFVNSEKYIIMWVSTICTLLLSCGINYFIHDLEKKIENIKIKNVLAVVLIILLLSVILVLTITGSLNVFKDNRKSYEIQIGNIEPNKEYIMDFELGEINLKENEENFKIEISEMDELTNEIYKTEIKEQEFLENRQIKIKMQDTTKIIKVIFTKINDDCKITINKLKINGKNKVLDYKLLPDMLEHRIQNTLMTQNGLKERAVFIIDGLNMIKDNLLFGKGGNAWAYEQYNYQQYFYGATQVHCYLLQVGIEYGILGIISLIGIIALTIYHCIRIKDKLKIEHFTIIVAILILLTHSLIDFEMSFLYIMQLFFILLAFLYSFETEKNNEKRGYISIIASIVIVIIAISYIILRPLYDSNIYLDDIEKLAKTVSEDENLYKQIDIEVMKDYEKYFKLERHYNLSAQNYFNYALVVQFEMTNENVEETINKLNFVYDAMQNINPKYDIRTLMSKYNECKLIADKIKASKIENEQLKNLEKKFYQMTLKESGVTIENVKKYYELYKISKYEKEYVLITLQNLCDNIQINMM